MKKLIPILLFFAATQAFSAGLVRYVDASVATSGNGLAWGTAWKNITNITGVGAGDIVYISGGSTSQIYTVNGAFTPPSGTSGSPFTLAISPETGRNGKAIFKYGTSGGQNQFLGNVNWVTLDGHLPTDAPNQNHFETQGYLNIFYSARNTGTATTNRGIVLRGFDTFDGAICYMYQTDQCEVGWCYFGLVLDTGTSPKIRGIGKDGPGAYGRNLVHHNEFHQYYIRGVDSGGNNGNDCIKEPQSCDIYNNSFIGHLMSGTPQVGGDHQDGIQTANDDFLRVYNNYFENMANYMVYIENQGGNISNIQIWNNVFNYSDSTLTAQPTQAIAIGSHNSGATMAKVQIFNNTFRGGNQTIALGDSNGSIANTCHVVNNLSGPNAGGMSLNGRNSGVTTNNVSMTGTANYVDVNGGNFRLTSSATAAINQGTSAFVSTITTTDADGNPRVAPWDVGAYEFGTTGPDVTPPTVATTVINGAGNQVTVTFSESVNFGSGGSAGWTLTPSGGAAGLSFLSGVGSNTLIYSITGRVINTGETVTVSYTQPGNGIESVASGADLASITNRAVTNHSTQGRSGKRPQTATPVITLAAGPYFGTQTTTITDADSGAGAVIHYTTDGSTPTAASPVYSAPISIQTNQTIQAIATWTQHLNSAVASSSYEVVSWTSDGTAWKTFQVPQQTGTFTWNLSITAPGAGNDAVVGIGPSAVSAYTGMACIIQFNNNTINAINGGGYTAGPAYTPNAIYNFVATINVTAHTWTVTVTPAAGGATTTIVTNAAFRTEQNTAPQLSYIGIQSISGTTTTSAMSSMTAPSRLRIWQHGHP